MSPARWPAVVDWGASPGDALAVGSWPFELVFIHSQTCGCGGRYEISDHRVLSRGGRLLERHRVRCARCQRRRAFWFDIAAFHDDPGAYLRFEETRALFHEAMSRVEEGDLDGARLRFAEVAAREPWFGLAHYHLGMIDMVSDEYQQARRHLETAAAILPMDASVHLALADLWSLVDDEPRGLRARQTAEALEALEERQEGAGVDSDRDGV